MIEELRKEYSDLDWEPVIQETMGNSVRADLPFGLEVVIEGSGVGAVAYECRIQTRSDGGRLDTIVFIRETGDEPGEAVKRTLNKSSQDIKELARILGGNYQSEKLPETQNEQD